MKIPGYDAWKLASPGAPSTGLSLIALGRNMQGRRIRRSDMDKSKPRSALHPSPTPVSAPVGVSGWQPIQTAPKDGTWIEAWRGSSPTGVWSNPVYVRWCQFDDGEGAWCWPDYTYDVTSDDARDSADTHVLNGDSYEDAVNFTDWRALPAAPARSPAVGVVE